MAVNGIDKKSENIQNLQPVENVIIMGSGPAGLTAALYTARAQLAPLLLTGMELHGQAALTYTIENYPGFPDGIDGAQLGELFQKQAERFGARIELDTVTEVDLSKQPFVLKTYDKVYQAHSLIISTGAHSNRLNVPGEKELIGRGVSYCATCDGWFFKGKKIVVVGGGDSALEEAMFLTRFASSVMIIHRRDALRAGALLQKRANENAKISLCLNTMVTEIYGTNKVEKLKLKNVVSNVESEIESDGIFIFIGQTPNSDLFKGQLDIDENGYIKTNNLLQTSIPGIFAAGEIADPYNRQVVTSAGMGATAGIQAARFLESLVKE